VIDEHCLEHIGWKCRNILARNV